jgi:hypothetical protein
MTPVLGKTTSNADCCGWEEYCRARKEYPSELCFSNNFIKVADFLIHFCWVDENSGCLEN